MNMIDGIQFWTPIFFLDIKQFLLAHGLNIFKWVVAGGIFPKDEVEQQQLILRTKCSPSQTLDDDPHNV